MQLTKWDSKVPYLILQNNSMTRHMYHPLQVYHLVHCRTWTVDNVTDLFVMF